MPQFGVRIRSIEISRQPMLRSLILSSTKRYCQEIHPGVPLSRVLRDIGHFQVSIGGTCAAFLHGRTSRKSWKSLEETTHDGSRDSQPFFPISPCQTESNCMCYVKYSRLLGMCRFCLFLKREANVSPIPICQFIYRWCRSL